MHGAVRLVGDDTVFALDELSSVAEHHHGSAR
jgi:hypothetical protein